MASLLLFPSMSCFFRNHLADSSLAQVGRNHLRAKVLRVLEKLGHCRIDYYQLVQKYTESSASYNVKSEYCLNNECKCHQKSYDMNNLRLQLHCLIVPAADEPNQAGRSTKEASSSKGSIIWVQLFFENF